MLRFTLPFLLLTIAYLPSPTMAIPFNPGLLPYGWFTEYECAIDTPSRVFVNIQSNDMGNNNTAFLCTRKCEYNGFVVAGVEATNWCYCGTGLVPSLPQPAPATDCSQPCTGDPNRSCGNHWRIQIYWYHSPSVKGPKTVSDPSGERGASSVPDAIVTDGLYLTATWK